MTARARTAPAAFRPRGFDPVHSAWALLCNVKFAVVLVVTALVACLLGVVLPQMPGPMRENAAARSAWMELRREEYGQFTGLMERLGLFDIFQTAWFNGLWVLIIVAVTVCTVSRLRPTHRSVRRPVREVGDRYFETAHHRAEFSHPGGVAAVEAALRKRRYTVERTREHPDGTVTLFAQRYPWAAYGTFASHLALLMLLVGALLTHFAGYDETFVIAEGMPAAPVFDRPGPDQIFVGVADAKRGIDGQGNIVDYRSELEVRRGGETVTCTTTVNDPCHAFGYRVHQAAFFDDIARLRIVDPGGRLVYASVVDFDSQVTAVPVLRVTGPDGAVLFDQALPQMATEPGASAGREDDLAVAGVTVPRPGAQPGETVTLPVTWRVAGDGLQVAAAGESDAPRELPVGEPVTLGDYRVEYVGAKQVPAILVGDMPGALSEDGVTVQMLHDRTGAPYLFVTGLAEDNEVFEPGKARTLSNGYTYTFEGQVEASGVSVRRDPGDTFIWVAVGLATIGLGITFYVPRRRLWAKVTPGRTYLAGVADRTTRFGRDLRLIGVEVGARDALRPGDIDERY